MVSRPQSDWKYRVTQGQIIGARPFLKFGVAPDIDTTPGEETVWDGGGIYVFPVNADTIGVASDNVNDTAAGTGARTVLISGLDEDYVEIEETVTLNGTSTVTTTNSFLRVNRIVVATVGSNSSNIGEITFTHNDASSTVAIIRASQNQTTMSNYTVPAGHTLLLENLMGAATRQASTTANIHFQIRTPNGLWLDRQIIPVHTQGATSFVRSGSVPYPVYEKYDIRIQVFDCTTNNTQISTSYDGVLVNNELFRF